MGAGYVGIVSIDLHLPEAASLKGKRRELLPLKHELVKRFGAAVAEVDHHDRWQRARLTAALVDRRSGDLARRLDELERFLLARFEGAHIDMEHVVKPEDL